MSTPYSATINDLPACDRLENPIAPLYFSSLARAKARLEFHVRTTLLADDCHKSARWRASPPASLCLLFSLGMYIHRSQALIRDGSIIQVASMVKGIYEHATNNAILCNIRSEV